MGPEPRLEVGARRVGLGLGLVYVLWAIVLFHPQWFVAAHGARIALKIPTALFILLAVVTLLHAKPGIWYPPLLVSVLLAFVTLPFASNIAYAIKPTKQLLLYYVLLVGTLRFVRTPRQAMPVILMILVYQFTWWSVLGDRHGLVDWDVVYNNYDSFGPLMVMGITSAAYAAFATRSKWIRRLALLTAALSVVGLVSSYARGAVMAAGLVLLVAWMRSRRKGLALAGVLAAVVMVGVTGELFFSNSNRGSDTNPDFIDEMLSIGAAVSAGQGEGTDRTVLWAIAWQEFLEQPLFGVGQDCFGVYAAGHFRPGQVGGPYRDNPGRLYNRAVHNTYFQTLAERGAIGTIVFAWLFVDFWRRNRRLRNPRAMARWAHRCGGAYDLRALAVAVEAAMVGYLATSMFYNQLLQVNWLWALLVVNLLLDKLSTRSGVPSRIPIAKFTRFGRA